MANGFLDFNPQLDMGLLSPQREGDILNIRPTPPIVAPQPQQQGFGGFLERPGMIQALANMGAAIGSAQRQGAGFGEALGLGVAGFQAGLADAKKAEAAEALARNEAMRQQMQDAMKMREFERAEAEFQQEQEDRPLRLQERQARIGQLEAEAGARIAEGNLASTEANKKFFEGTGKAEAARIDKLRTEADEADSVVSDVNIMRNLLSETAVQAPFGLGSAASIFDPDARAAQSKATELQLSFTNQTKGAISDREMALFARATPSVNNLPAANEKILNGMEAGARRKQERANFTEAYRNANGTLNGAQQAWQRFIDENPIVDDQLNINAGNISNWQGYISNGGMSSEPSTMMLGGVEVKVRRK